MGGGGRRVLIGRTHHGTIFTKRIFTLDCVNQSLLRLFFLTTQVNLITISHEPIFKYLFMALSTKIPFLYNRMKVLLDAAIRSKIGWTDNGVLSSSMWSFELVFWSKLIKARSFEHSSRYFAVVIATSRYLFCSRFSRLDNRLMKILCTPIGKKRCRGTPGWN